MQGKKQKKCGVWRREGMEKLKGWVEIGKQFPISIAAEFQIILTTLSLENAKFLEIIIM